MKEATKRGLENATKLMFESPEFDRVRLFLVAEAGADKPESDEIILYVCNAVRDHLLQHNKAVRVIAQSKRAV